MEATEDTPSVAPDALTVTEATLCQAGDPPLAVGAVGFVRSMRTVEPEVAEAGAQPLVLPAWSAVRNCTRVSPSAVTVAVLPAAGALQVVPPSVLVRCS
ncbi:MAG: hypothetical protein U0237_03830 [Thermoleophilia bacterium]